MIASRGAIHVACALGAGLANEAVPRAQAYCADVVDQHDHPVHNAHVTVFWRNGPGASSSGCGAQTDDHGHFCLDGDWHCQGGYLDVALPDDQGGPCTGGVELPDAARPQRITMPIDDRPVAQLVGHVIDDRGRPIAGARIGYVSRSPMTGKGCVSDSPAIASRDGSFSLATRRGDVDVSVSAAGYASHSATLATSHSDNRVVLDTGISWRGRVRAPDGRALDRVKLTLSDIDGVRIVPLSRGAFDLRLLAPGVKTIQIEIPDDPLLGKRDEWQEITIGTDKQQVADVRFSSGLDLSGTTEPGACIWAYPERQEHDHPRSGMYVTVTADDAGRFTIHHAVRGKWVVRICKEIAMVVSEAGRSDIVIHSQ